MGNGGCCRFRRRRLQAVDAKSYEPLLQQEEKEAVNNLLKYYDEGKKKVIWAIVDGYLIVFTILGNLQKIFN